MGGFKNDEKYAYVIKVWPPTTFAITMSEIGKQIFPHLKEKNERTKYYLQCYHSGTKKANKPSAGSGVDLPCK